MSTDEHHPPTAYDNPPHGDNHPRHEQRQPTGAESPHNLLAVHDPSRRRQTPRPAPARGGGVTVQWLRPTELATRWADKSWPSARPHASTLAALPTGAFPGVDTTEVYQFLDRHAPAVS